MNNIKRNIVVGIILILVPFLIVAALAAMKGKNVDYADGCHVRGGTVWHHDDHTNTSALKCMEDHGALSNKGVFVLDK